MELSTKKINHKTNLEFLGFTIPAVIAILLFVEIPFIMSVAYSFTRWNGLDRAPKFIGLENYIELLTDDKVMVEALIFTFVFTLFFVVAVNVIALLLALVLDSKIFGRNAFRAAFYIPNIISLIVIGYIWRFIFSNGFESLGKLTEAGIFQLSWLGDGKMAFISVILVSVWQATGFYMVIYIAGLQTVPRELVEAATIDGAGSVKRFISVVFPLIMPSVTVCVFYAISNGFKIFDIILSLTFGGPGTATTSIALDIYKTAFNDNRFGYGAAKSVLLFAIILAVTVFQLTIFKKREVEV